MRPGIGTQDGKLWGETQLIFEYNNTSCHLISVKKGGYCSLHKHDTKWNRFVVLSGKLKIDIHLDALIDSTILEEDGITDVPPTLKHRFIALEDTVALEFYWAELSHEDIDRGGTVGGMKTIDEEKECP